MKNYTSLVSSEELRLTRFECALDKMIANINHSAEDDGSVDKIGNMVKNAQVAQSNLAVHSPRV